MEIEHRLLESIRQNNPNSLQGTTRRRELSSHPDEGNFLPLIILASGSQNRIRFMETLGVPFLTIPSNFDEKSITENDPYKKVQQIARMKAYFVAAQNPGIVISADTFNVFGNRQYEKPVSNEDAKDMLRSLSGRNGSSITGICVLNTQRGTETTSLKKTDVACKTLDEEEIEDYVRNNPVTEWAGAYNPLEDASKRIFYPIDAYLNGLEYGLSRDIVISELEIAGFKIS